MTEIRDYDNGLLPKHAIHLEDKEIIFLLYGSGLTDITELRNDIFSILDDIIAFYYRWFYGS